MAFTNKTIKVFIEDIVNLTKTNNNIKVDDILDECKTQSEKGFIFERLFDIIIKFGFCNIFPNSDYYHLIGNSNNGNLKVLENFNQYLNEKVLSSNSGGCSDITLQHKKDNTYIFISSKYPKSNDDITEDEFYKLIGLTNDEITQIYK
jgi:hypothetical protein